MDKALAIFRTIATEFSDMTDDSVLAFMEVFAMFVSKKVFGSKYDVALAYFTAHMLTLDKMKATVGAADGSFADVKREYFTRYAFPAFICVFYYAHYINRVLTPILHNLRIHR